MSARILRAYRRLLSAVEILTNGALILLVVVVSLAVAVRYFGVLGGSLHWADELSRFTMIWLVMLGSVLAFDRGAHVAVDLLPKNLPPVASKPIKLIAYLLSAAFIVVLVWQGLALALRTMRQISPALGVPMGYIYLAVPAGAALMGIQAVLFWFIPQRAGISEAPSSESGHTTL